MIKMYAIEVVVPEFGTITIMILAIVGLILLAY
jgi:predicted secreted protein with PEFG-CTERM motif